MSLSVSFRNATAADVTKLVKVEERAFPKAAYDSFRFGQGDFVGFMQDPDYKLIVAEGPCGAIAGYALVDLSQQDPSAANLDSIAVNHHYQGTGLEALLVKQAEVLALKHAFPAMTLEVHEKNKAGLKAMKGAGYKRVGTEKGYYDDGAKAVLLEKRLKQPKAVKGI